MASQESEFGTFGTTLKHTTNTHRVIRLFGTCLVSDVDLSFALMLLNLNSKTQLYSYLFLLGM